ncbi:MAG: YggS family pyridoxal phosphate-dependent enzyme [Patescibacteria group bacterium]
MMAENLKKIQEKVGARVALVAVTKGRSVDDVMNLVSLGVRVFGENRVQEAREKFENLKNRTDIELHMIGRLQSNKVREAVGLFDVIQSIDSLKLLEIVSHEAFKIGKKMRVFIQINASKDPAKTGVMPDAIFEFFRNAHEVLCEGSVVVEGLMTIVEHTPDIEARRPFFTKMKKIFDDLREIFPPDRVTANYIEHVNLQHLSMGMSDDFEVAIEEGATMVRIGRLLFE